MKGELIFPAWPPRAVNGPVLRLDVPFSFWGGIDPVSGTLTDPRTPVQGQTVAGRILIIRHLRGSSSTSAVLLELIHRGLAPAGILVSQVDAILVIGAVVAREMGWSTPPIVRVPETEQDTFPSTSRLAIDTDGVITVSNLDFDQGFP